ncbi:hypothetical protein F5Y18DRAFT_377270 [Xylariaceae sp. FL1019]|nr:hypothetical protein F5Y18DRAFT_377270 [Xylariaceae sp. FL1019]
MQHRWAITWHLTILSLLLRAVGTTVMLAMELTSWTPCSRVQSAAILAVDRFKQEDNESVTAFSRGHTDKREFRFNDTRISDDSHGLRIISPCYSGHHSNFPFRTPAVLYDHD